MLSEGAEAIGDVVEGAVGRGALVYAAAQCLQGDRGREGSPGLGTLVCSSASVWARTRTLVNSH